MNEQSNTASAPTTINAPVPGSQTVVANETDGLRPIGSIGKSQTVLKDGEEAVLFEHHGKGCLSHFWFGGNFEGVEDTRIRYYVDGEETASIDMDLYLGHGIGFHDNQAPWATKFFGKIGKRNGVFNNYRIPFGTSIRVTAQRSGEAAADGRIWWIIRGVENGRVALGGVSLPAAARLKLHRIEEQDVDPLAEFTLADLSGRGAIYQVTMTAEGLDDTPNRINYLEACMRAYLDGSKEPLVLSSGLEDYFLGTYYFDTGKYYADIAGLTHFDKARNRFAAYRFHDHDPIFFQNGLRLTCRNCETIDGSLDGPPHSQPPRTRYTTYTWVYEW